MVEVRFVNMESKNQVLKIVAEVRFVSTTSKDQVAKIVVEARFVGTTSKDHIVKIVAEVKFTSSRCQGCGGSQICEHNKQRSECPTCDPLGHLAGVVRSRVYIALKNDKEMSSTEYLGCNIETFEKHIEQQFTEGMSWEGYGEWHIDHKIPLKYNKPSHEEIVVQRLHYTNTQPMWASENMSKGCRYISG